MLATVERIEQIKEHPNADRLELAKVLDYQVVVQKGLYNAGEIVIYIRPDTVLPVEAWSEEYRKYSPKRVKAVRLRGEWSEGIILRKDIAPDKVHMFYADNYIGTEVSEQLNVEKYEPPIPQELNAKGILPYGIPTTDEERFENIIEDIPFGEICDVTLKIDGQSWSAYYHIDDDAFGILGRRFEYKLDGQNFYTDHLKRYGFKDKFIEYCKRVGKSLCIRGESYGQGIQKSKLNVYSKKARGLAIFSVWLIDERRYAHKGDEFYFPGIADAIGIPHVPILEKDIELTKELIDHYSKDIEKLPNGDTFEGVVINTPSTTFKVINKYYDSRK